MLGTYRMVRGDRQRLPSWDATEYITLDTLDSTDIDETDVPDLTDRTVDLSLVTKARGGDRIALSNAVEIGDPTAGEVAITLEEADTAVPIDGVKTNLYGEFRISGGTNDPTTAGVIKIELYPSRHDVEGEAQLLPYVDDFGSFAVDGVMDAEGARISTLADPVDPQDAVNEQTLSSGLSSKADSDGGGTSTLSNYASIGTEQLYNVSTGTQFVDAITNASDGDWIKVRGTIEVDQWPELDGVSGVTIEGDGVDASTIRVADGGNVGTLRIGYNTHCENITVRGIRFDGNYVNQDAVEIDHHSISIKDADNVRVAGCWMEGQYPHHVHNDGGSGVSVTSAATNVWVVNNRFDDVGDRCVEIAATGAFVIGNRMTNCFDRAVSTRMQDEDKTTHTATNAVIHNNHISNVIEGSAMAAHGADESRVVVSNNVVIGDHNSLIRIQGTDHYVIVTGNIGHLYNNTGETNHGIRISPGVRKIVTSDNVLIGYGNSGIFSEADVEGVVIGNNYIAECDNGVNVRGDYVTIVGNNVQDTTNHAYHLRGNYQTIVGNMGQGAGGIGLHIDTASTQNLIVGNWLMDNRLTTTGFEVGMGGVSDSLIACNRIGAGTNGVSIFEGGDNNHFTANYCEGDINVGGANTTWESNRPTPQVDVRNYGTVVGQEGYHDGSGTDNTAGPAFYNGTDWVSLVDGSTITADV